MAANSTHQGNDNPFHIERTRAGLFALGAAGLLLCLLGGWVWHASRSSEARGAWRAIAQGQRFLREGRPDLAFLVVHEVRDEEPWSGEAAALKGHVWIKLGEYHYARLALERALSLQPNQFEAAVTLANLNLDLGNGLRGAEVLEMAARLRPRDLGVWLAMGEAFKDIGENSRAAHAFEKALELGHGEALVALIDTLLRSGQSDRAGPWVVKALASYPDDPVVLGFAAHTAFDADRLGDAMTMAERALRGDPNNIHALLTRARFLSARSQWEAALCAAERAAAAAPQDAGVLYLLAIIEGRLGFTAARLTLAKLKRARERLDLISTLNLSIASNPEDPRLPWRRGRLAWESGIPSLASRCFQAALALNPKFQPAQESLAALRASRPDPVPVRLPTSFIRTRTGTPP